MSSRRIGTVKGAVISIDKKLRGAVSDSLFVSAKTNAQKVTKVVGTWDRKPTFKVKRDATDEKQVIRWLVLVTGNPLHVNIWGWVDWGTGEAGPTGQGYLIFPVNAPALVFNRGYEAKTAPVALYNVGSGVANGALVVSLGVYHPGIRPRLFTKTYAESSIEPLIKDLRERIKLISKGS